MTASKNVYKQKSNSNPISSNVFCADPGAIVYNGRVYVYGTNDQQQFLQTKQNSYERITSIVCFSSDDMANWTFHGEIDVKAAAPWILNSWAPDVCIKKMPDGSDKFYMYFSNNGCGVGVLCADSPLGPWKDPLGEPIVDMFMPELFGTCPNPFDPGACIDENGTGWLCFGGGIPAGFDESFPGSARIARLNDDMISFATEFLPIPAPYFFESSNIRQINGTYIYTYNNNWGERTKWDYDAPKPSQCSMSCMMTKTPEIPESWEYKNHYFMNPGDMGLNYSNNHISYVKFNGQWYIFFHTLLLQENMPFGGGFRSICVNKLEFDEEKVEFSLSMGSRRGVEAIKNVNPFKDVAGTTIFTSADLGFEDIYSPERIASKACAEGAWFMVKNVDLKNGASKLQAELKGKGSVELRIDNLSNPASAVINLDSSDSAKSLSYQQLQVQIQKNDAVDFYGVKDVYFVFSNADICIKKWKLIE
ncbi:MAG: family 43 glycosylhydrolase [Treponema sp.]|nr:family 43 glycosylhydrolase [Treponema sp.]